MRSIQSILDGLAPDDSRKKFWDKLGLLIGENRYEEALRMLMGNCDDTDFNDQVEAVAKSIVDKWLAAPCNQHIAKGMFNGNCNRTACGKSPADHQHRDNKKWYCRHCAIAINNANPEVQPPLFVIKPR
jgi:hypothetical protein